MVIDKSLLAARPQGMALWALVARQVRPGGELQTLVKKYRRENDIWVHLELLKWLLFCPDTYMSSSGFFGEKAEEVFAIADLDFDYLDMGPEKIDSEFKEILKAAYENLSLVYKQSVVSFYAPYGTRVSWRHSALHFYVCGSILEWQTWARSQTERPIARTFPRRVLSFSSLPEQEEPLKQWAMMDKRELVLASVDDMIEEERERRLNTEMQLQAEAVRERSFE